MQNVMVMGNAGAQTIGQNLTRYFGITGDETNASTEATVQTRLRDSFTWSRLRAYISSNTFAAGNNTTLAFRKNGVTSTAVTISIDGGVTGEVEDLTGSEGPVSGDLINYVIVTPNVAGAIGVSFVESLLDGSVGIFQVDAGSRLTAAASTTYYCPPDGALIGTSWTTEAWAQMAARETVTVDRLRGYLASIGTGGSLTIRTRIGGANGNQSIAWTGTTGEQEDTTNSDAMSNGNLFNYSIANTNTAGTTSLAQIQLRHNGTQSFLGCVNLGAVTVASALTRDYLPEGDLEVTTTEAQAQVDANATRVLKNMRVHLSANSINGSSTFTLRQDGVDTALAVTFPASTAGTQEDLVDSVTYTATQEMSTRLVTGGTMNSMTPRIIQYTQEDEAVAADELMVGRRAISMP